MYNNVLEELEEDNEILKFDGLLESRLFLFDIRILYAYFHAYFWFTGKTEGRTNKKKKEKNYPTNFRYLIFLYFMLVAFRVTFVVVFPKNMRGGKKK